ncbi:MAG: PDZ domain-containing protein, partial [Pirellula sp.]
MNQFFRSFVVTWATQSTLPRNRALRLCRKRIWVVFAVALLNTSWAVSQDKKADAATDTKVVKKDKQRGGKNSERLDAIEGMLEKIVDKLQLQDPKKPAPSNPDTPKPTQAEAPKTSIASASKLPEQPPAIKLSPDQIKSIQWRSIGPANMSGRITDIAVHDKDPSLWYIATASGGILKTTNQGTTITHQFDKQETVSIGAIAVDPNDVNVVWVGTGEANPRNSVSYGDGVYKSTDAGVTWKNMGLKKTYQIGKILVHPKDSKTVYVGALGRLYGPSEDRGVYKTTNGGETWERVLYLDDKTGVIDMFMDPTNPETLVAAMWDRQRDGFDSWPGSVAKPDGIDGYDPIRKWGPSAGLYKTTDGGKNWKKLVNGLPTSNIGRIGLDWQSKGTHSLFAIIDCEDIGKGPAPFAAFLGIVGANQNGKPVVVQILPKSPAEKAGFKVGDQIVSMGDDTIADFDQTLEILRKKKVGEKVSTKVRRGDETLNIDAELTARPGTNQGGQSQLAGVWLGVTGEDRDNKIVITNVTANAPADKAGVKEGDVITHLEDKPTGNYLSLISQIRTKSAGDKVKLTLSRGTENLDVTIALEMRPGSQSTAMNPQSANVYLGIQGDNADNGGALLIDITPDGPAQKAGLQVGDVVRSIGGRNVADYASLVATVRQFKAGEKTKVTILREGETKEIEVTPEERVSGLANRPHTYSYFGQSPNVQDMQGANGHLYGGVYRSDDGGESWQRVNSLNTRPMYFSVVRVDPSDSNYVYVLGVNQFRSNDGGKTFTGDFGRNVHADSHDLWIDSNDGRHMVIGGDGGFYVTHDRGENWDHVNTAAIGQFYHVAIGPKYPYWVFGGLQDNGSWGGPAISKQGGALNEDWISVGGGDGFVCRVDQQDPDLVYSESQNGTIGRRHLKTGERASIRPTRAPNGQTYRFNWNTPFILSNFNSKIFYCAGNFVFRSLDRGNNLVPFSPEITLTQRGSATALCESPKNPSILYVGTDDGALWVSRNGGTDWKNITANLGIPKPRWVSTIEASRFEDGRVFVALDGHRSDDDEPYLFASNDFGDTWQSIRSNIPWGSTRCLREDISNPDMLYVGTEFAFWVSLDRGANWTKMNTNLPTVAIHEV